MHKVTKVFRKLFTKDTDKQVDAIFDSTLKQIRTTAGVAKEQRDLLQKNGVLMQIYIASGGADRHV